MSFLKDFLQNFFGREKNNDRHDQVLDDYHRYSKKFRNPIWENGEEDDDDYGNDFRRSTDMGPGIHFNIFTNPLEIHRYFESEMHRMMKDIFNFDNNSSFIEFPNVPKLELPSTSEKIPLRDKVLKPGCDIPPSPYTDINALKVDDDLDGKINASDLPAIWEDSDIEKPQFEFFQNKPNFGSFGKSIISQTIRRPDGTIEEKITESDSMGNSKTTVRRQIDDKIHTVITMKNKDGVISKSENSDDIYQGGNKHSGREWIPIEEPKIESGTLKNFPWHKFFNISPDKK